MLKFIKNRKKIFIELNIFKKIILLKNVFKIIYKKYQSMMFYSICEKKIVNAKIFII